MTAGESQSSDVGVRLVGAIFDKGLPREAQPGGVSVTNGNRLGVNFFAALGGVFGETVPPPLPRFIRGDCNRDGRYDLSDAVRHLLGIFRDVAIGCRDACDTNDDEALNVADAIATLDALYRMGTPQGAPIGVCGVDPSGDDLGCEDPLCP